ncbi:MAG: VanW family protein, partial [Bifidobacteriaceae bacterium]|nr:VanW family protein [Bifidobacteriaceae bacterium]
VDFDDEPTALIPAEDKPTVRISVEDRVGEPKSAPPAPIPPRRVSVAETSQAEETADLATRPEPPTGEQPPISQEDPTRNDTKPLPISKRERRRLSRKRRRAWIPVLVAVVVLVAGYVGAALYFADRVPKGAQVAGIEIGGLEKSQAIDKLTAGLAAAAKEPIEVSIGEAQTTLDPVLAGMSFSAEQSVAAVTGLSFDPRRLWDQVSGIGNVALVTTVDRAALETELGRLAAETATEGQNGTVSVAGGTVEVTDPQPGVLLDQTAALAEVTVKYLVTPGPWALPVVEQEPKIGAEALSAAVSELAEPILTGGVRVQVGTNSVEIPAADLAAAALIAPAGPEATSLTLSWDQELLTAAVTSRLPAGVLSDARDARFEFVDGQPQIVDGQAGVTLDVPAMVESINSAALATAEARQAEAPLIEIDPEAGRAELEQLGIVEVVGRFETQATADYNRNQNLRKASDIVTGVLVKPGETFSLDKALGHRSKETGWFDAGVVVAGVSQDGIGGGLSQFSTTLYNAGHLAGMVDVTHTPHSNYFSRYPRGREATIWEGQIDNQFKNDTPYGVLLRAGLTSDLRLWVELWSTKYWTVEAEIGQPYSFTSPKTIDSTAADCKPQSAGGSGFQVDYWRIKTDPNGNAQAKETWHWRYQPMNASVCKRR